MKRQFFNALICFLLLITGILKPVYGIGCSKQSKNLSDSIVHLEYDFKDELDHIEDFEKQIYEDLITSLDSDEYLVEEVKVSYVSKEYLEELDYNSQSNLFFGYSLSELNENFQDTKYFFTLDENGQTIVQELQEITDNTGDTILRNVAVGSGVILVCVTVSAVAGTVGAPAAGISVIFAGAGKLALTSALTGGICSGIITAIETGDTGEVLKAASLAASEGFKWGAISGAIAGGGSKVIKMKQAAKNGFTIKEVTKNGLSVDEAVKIQRETKWPIESISKLNSYEEAKCFKNPGLKPQWFGDTKNRREVWTRKINWSFKDEFGRSNIERVTNNLSPIAPDRNPYELHHIGQNADGALAILTKAEHHNNETYKALHYAGKGKDITGAAFQKEKNVLWKQIMQDQLSGNSIVSVIFETVQKILIQ